MPVSCRSCGASLIENTRFCRRCGTPLSSAASSDDSVGGSPAVPIVLPSDPGRPTKGLPPEESYRVGSETTRVNRADLDALLRQSSDARPADHDPSSLPTGQRNGYDNQPGSASAALPDFYKTVVSSDNSLARTTPTFTTGGLEKNDHVESPDTFATNVQEAHGDDDEELTIVPPMQSPPAATIAPAMTATVADSSSPSTVVAHQSAAAGSAPGNVPAARPSPQANARVIWLAVAVVSVMFLCVLAAGAWLAFDYFRRPVAVAGGGEASPIPVADPKQLFDEKMAEAESLLAAGELEKAVASLREANRLDTANTRAHWRLGDLLLETGRRREAIEEYRAVTRNDPSDRAAWRVLASAQLAESAYDEAAESYRRLLGLSDKVAQDANDLLAYADALRLANRADEARAVYQEVSSSTITEAANAARMRLTELTAQLSPAGAVSSQTTQLGSARPTDNDEGEAVAVNAMPAATPTPAPSATPAPPVSNAALAPAEHFNRAVGLWASNRAAAIAEFRAAANGGSADAYYYLGLGIVEGRDPGTLKRAELIAAMSYFQAARRGRFGAQSQRYEAQLGKEYDRRKKE
ncbi:MAG: tetratricopeptide repeat protein [Acidobacteriota bacterium]|nr:tetratricopeptide repeat protein [Acidobacteriota bacterium]